MNLAKFTGELKLLQSHRNCSPVLTKQSCYFEYVHIHGHQTENKIILISDINTDLISRWMSILTAPRLTPLSRAVWASSSRRPILLSVEFIRTSCKSLFSGEVLVSNLFSSVFSPSYIEWDPVWRLLLGSHGVWYSTRGSLKAQFNKFSLYVAC